MELFINFCFLGYLLGNGIWLLSSYSLDFASPILFFLCFLLVLLPILLSFLRNEHFELWNGNFYDSERNFANVKQWDSSAFLEVVKKNSDIENSNNKNNNKTVKDDENFEENSVNTRRNMDVTKNNLDEKNQDLSDKNKKKKQQLNENNKNLWEGLMDSEEEGKEERWGGRTLYEMRGITKNFE